MECSDVSISRTNRIEGFFNQIVPEDSIFKERYAIISVSFFFKMNIIIKLTNNLQKDGRDTQGLNYFDKVIVDAPCINDRVSLNETDNNWFKTTRVKERLKLPELQSQLIV